MVRLMLAKSPLAFSLPDFLHRVLVRLTAFEAGLPERETGAWLGSVWVVCRPPPLILTGPHSSPGYDWNLPKRPQLAACCGTGLSSAFLTTICRPMVWRVFNDVRAWEQVHDWRHKCPASYGVFSVPHPLLAARSQLWKPAMKGWL